MEREQKEKEFGGIRLKGKEEKREENKKKERGGNEKREKRKRGFHILSKIYGDWAVDFRRSKKQSRSTQRELRISTKIKEFCQTPRGREFS